VGYAAGGGAPPAFAAWSAPHFAQKRESPSNAAPQLLQNAIAFSFPYTDFVSVP
jgi:hypothetical protein